MHYCSSQLAWQLVTLQVKFHDVYRREKTCHCLLHKCINSTKIQEPPPNSRHNSKMKQVPCLEPTNIKSNRTKFHHHSKPVSQILYTLGLLLRQCTCTCLEGPSKSTSELSPQEQHLDPHLTPTTHIQTQKAATTRLQFLDRTLTNAFHARAIMAKFQFHILAHCIFCDFTHSLYGHAQMTIMLCPRYYTIFGGSHINIKSGIFCTHVRQTDIYLITNLKIILIS